VQRLNAVFVNKLGAAKKRWFHCLRALARVGNHLLASLSLLEHGV